MHKAVGLLIAALMVLTGCSASAQNVPALTGRIVDDANLLDLASKASLTRKLENAENRFGTQMVIVTVKSLGGKSIEDFGLALGNTWGIGNAERDDGMVLIVAPNERRVRIEVGYGMEDIFPDQVCQDILDATILPRFRDGQLQQGITDGAARILDRIATFGAKSANDNDIGIGLKEAT